MNIFFYVIKYRKIMFCDKIYRDFFEKIYLGNE